MERLIYWIAIGFVKFLQLLPPRVCDRLGSALGTLAWALLPPYRRLVHRNLQIAFGKKLLPHQIATLTRRHFASLGANLAGAVRFFNADEALIRAHTRLENLHHLLEAHRRGKGVVLAISHSGNWEMFAQACFYAPELPFGTIYQRIHNRYLDAWLTRMRQKRGVQTFERRSALAEAASFLKKGGVLGILVDQHAGDAGIWTPLFSKLASTSPLAATLAIRTGAAVVPVSVTRTAPAFWHIRVRPEIPTDASVEELTARINRVLEEQIEESPMDWFWVHNRWKLPRPQFLLANTKRGIYLPSQTPPENLQKLRVLLRSSNWLGDAVMNVPAVRAIRQGRPDLHLAILTPEKLADFWRALNLANEVIPIPPYHGPLRTALALRKHNFDVAILFPNSLRVALEAWIAGIPRRVAYPGHFRQWLLNQIVQEKKSQPYARPEHQSQHYLRLAQQIGAPIESLPTPPTPPPPPKELWLGVCPGAEYGPAKRWPLDRFRQTMQLLTEQLHCGWKIFGLPKDEPLGNELAANFPGSIQNLCGKTSLGQLIAQLQTIHLLLTNDTGTMHLAALLGVPVVAIFGSTSPELTAPLGPFCRVIRKRVECAPCFRRECPLDFRCMLSIDPTEVAAAITELLHLRWQKTTP